MSTLFTLPRAFFSTTICLAAIAIAAADNLMDKPVKGHIDLRYFPEEKCFQLGPNYLDLDTGVIASEKRKWRVNEQAALLYTPQNTTRGYLFDGASVFATNTYKGSNQKLQELSSVPFYLSGWTPDLQRIIDGSKFAVGEVETGAEDFLEGFGGVADHVHLLLGLNATARLADVVRDIKAVSSKWVHDETGHKPGARVLHRPRPHLHRERRCHGYPLHHHQRRRKGG